MSSTYEDALFDFEIDFLIPQPTTNYTVPELHARIERLRKSIVFLKPRIRQISHYVAAFKIVTKELDDLKINQSQTKESCRQHLSELNDVTNKVAILENEKLEAEAREKQKNEKICELENKVTALQMVHTQLKILVKEQNRTEPTSFKVDRKKGKAGDNAQKRFLEREIETLRKDNSKILNLQKENEKLCRDNTRIPILEKQIENLCKNNILVSKSKEVNDQNEIARIQKLEKEIETLRKENANILKLEAEIEILNKDNANIPKYKNEIGKLLKENVKIQKLEKEIEILNKDIVNIPKYLNEIGNLQKENTRILKLEKEIESLNKENDQIPNLIKEIGNLRKDNASVTKLKKEIEILNKENVKIPNLIKEIEILRKENAKISMFGNENETIKQNIEISNLEKDIETLHTVNEKIENVNNVFNKEIFKIPNKGEEIETHLTNLTLTMEEKGELPLKKSNLTRNYKSLPNRNSECSDNSEAENYDYEDPQLSLTSNDTIVAVTSPIADQYIAVLRESDNENSNEFVSTDTGRGSSLANSDTDKGPHSSDYFFNDSPSNGDNIVDKEETEDATMSCSPIVIEKMEIPTITISKHNENQNDCERKGAFLRKSHSKLLKNVNQTNAASKGSNSVVISDNVSSRTGTHGVQQKECLESNCLQCDSHTDLELEQIFSTMKLSYNAVTPIPRTPTRVLEENSRSGPSGVKEKVDTCVMCDTNGEFMKKVAELLLLYAQPPNSDTNNGIDGLLAAVQLLLKSKHAGHTKPNIISNMEKSDYTVSHGDNNLRLILHTESISSSPEKDTQVLQYKKDENRLSQNIMSLSMLQDENHNQLLRNDNCSVLNPSSPVNINVLKKKQVEQGLHCLSISDDVSTKQLLNSSISEEFATDNGISEVISICKKAKNRKITKLEKLKKKLKPKYKIRREKTPTDNLRFKPRQIFAIKKQVTVNDTSASLNKKDVYEKAVKIMAEINLQQSAKLAKSPPKDTKGVMSPRRSASLERYIQSNGNNQECVDTTQGKIKFSEIELSPCSVVLIKDPLLLSPRKIGNSITHQAKEHNNSTTCRATEDNNCTPHKAKENDNLISPKAKEDDNATTHKVKESNSTTLKAKEDNNVTHRAKEDNPITQRAKENNNSTTLKTKADNNSKTHRAKEDNNFVTHGVKEENNSMTRKGEEDENVTSHSVKEDNESFDELPKKRRRRSSNEPLTRYKRVLRSDTVHKRLSVDDNIEPSKVKGESNTKSTKDPRANDSDTQLVPNNDNTLRCLQLDQQDKNVVSYGDLDIFSEDSKVERKASAPVKERAPVNTDSSVCPPKESILCHMIEKYGVQTVKPFEKKIPDKIVKPISEKIEEEITKIRLMSDSKNAMNGFVADLRKLDYKHFIAGLIDYLMKPERKNELFGKVSSSPAPAMTKSEQILLYVIAHLKTHWPSVDIVDAVLSSIEFALFKLNRTPEFNIIESTSHFYAVLCRYFQAKSRLRLFILDAMYCIQYKSVPLIKQCLDVWMHIIPLAHMGIAKSPLVTCLVYLLHFYKCDDKHNRVQDIRNILVRKYFYQITDWNESKILEMFKNSIKDLKDISLEKKMLRLALIILAKRHGPQWCQTHIIKNLLHPMIEKENIPNNVKEFCVSMIGPLMKPYPADMKVHCEIAINQLMHILNNNPSAKMEEAAITSMIYINRHDQRSINKMLLSRKMKPMSLELQKTIRDYVKLKPLKIWKKILAPIAR